MTPSTQHTPSPKRRRWWLRGLRVLLFIAVIGGAIAFLFREQLMDEWQLRQFRQAAAAGDPDLPQYQERLLERLRASEEHEKFDLATRLAYDANPKVRVAAVDVLLANQPRAKKQDARDGLFAVAKFGAWRTRVSKAVEHLLADDDEAVRKKAIQAVSELKWVFGSQLADALKGGSKEERSLVAESLAHWDAGLLCQTIADAKQPDEVRMAAMRSLDRYGDREIASRRDELRNALKTALQSENKELRRAAVLALRYAQGAASVWLDLLGDDQHKEQHQLVLRTWIDALGSETTRSQHWWETHYAWSHADARPRRCAVATYVMCEAAQTQMQHLDKTPPISEHVALQDRQGPTGRAFDAQLNRLGNILSVVSAVRWYCGNDFTKDMDFTVWLPHETPQGAPPQRKLKTFQFQQVKPIWEWCLGKKPAYPTRFLTANSIENYASMKVPQPVPVRTLGAVMDELVIPDSQYQILRNRYEQK